MIEKVNDEQKVDAIKKHVEESIKHLVNKRAADKSSTTSTTTTSTTTSTTKKPSSTTKKTRKSKKESPKPDDGGKKDDSKSSTTSTTKPPKDSAKGSTSTTTTGKPKERLDDDDLMKKIVDADLAAGDDSGSKKIRIVHADKEHKSHAEGRVLGRATAAITRWARFVERNGEIRAPLKLGHFLYTFEESVYKLLGKPTIDKLIQDYLKEKPRFDSETYQTRFDSVLAGGGSSFASPRFGSLLRESSEDSNPYLFTEHKKQLGRGRESSKIFNFDK